jgi:hypothetical protein
VFRRSEPLVASVSSALVKEDEAEHRCDILDVSERGARIAISDVLTTDCFDLIVGRSGPARAARVRWRRGNEVGVQFGPRQSGDIIPDIHLAAADPPQSLAISSSSSAKVALSWSG